MAKTNAYSLFVRDNHKRMQREGKHVEFTSLFKELSSKWTSLPEAERQKYKDRAKQPAQSWSKDTPARGSHSNPVSHVLSDTKPNTEPKPSRFGAGSNPNSETKPDIKPLISDINERKVSTKRSYEEIDWDKDNDEQLLEQNEKKLKLGVPNHWRARSEKPERYQDIHLVKIRETCKAIVAARGADKLMTSPMFSFSCNVLCFQRSEKGETYVPIEIGIFSYSIRGGRYREPYHVLIDAGPPLDGCINLASDHAEATHKITIPPKNSYPQGARKDYRKIYKEMLEYTKDGERTILVWDAREMKQIIGSLEWLYEKANQQMGPGKLARVSTWTVLPVVEFVANVANFIEQKVILNDTPVFAVHYFYNMMLDKSLHDYEQAYMCQYHKMIQTKWCAKSCATRMILNLEDAFHKIRQGYDHFKFPRFVSPKKSARHMPPNIQHKPSEQSLADQPRVAAAGQQDQASQESENQQSQESMLALPAPGQVTSPEGGTDSTNETINNPDGPIATTSSASTETVPDRIRYVEQAE